MSRAKKLLLNTGTGLLKQLITVVCGFVLPMYMLLFFGSEVNGLVSSITHYLSFISLLDMGVGAVVQANLYKPLNDRDDGRISLICVSSDRFFRRLGLIFSGYIAVLCVIFPLVIDSSFTRWYSVSLLLIISVSTFVQYLFGMTNQLLLNADQKSYVHLIMQIGTIILNTVLSVILMKAGASVHTVRIVTASVYLIRPIGQAVYIKRHYRINRKIVLDGEPIKQKWNGFSQHFAAVVCQNIDIVALSLFSSLKNVSIYSVYFNVTNGVEQLVFTSATGLESLFGNMIANGEKKELKRLFNSVEWLFHTGVTIIFTIAGICIVPFVKVYTKGITDTDYVAPLFGAVLVTAYASQCLRVPYFRVIKAAGHFRETQNGAYISALLNIVITIVFVFKFGLVGAAVGTLVAMAYHTCYFVWYLRKHILERPVAIFVKHTLIDAAVAGASCLATLRFSFVGDTYGEWILYALSVSAFVVAISAVFNLIFNFKHVINIFKSIKRRLGSNR